MGELKNLNFDEENTTTETIVPFNVEYNGKTYFGEVHIVSTEPASEQEDYESVEIKKYRKPDGKYSSELDEDAEDLKDGDFADEIIEKCEDR